MSRRSKASVERAEEHSPENHYPTDRRYTRGFLRSLDRFGIRLPSGIWVDPAYGCGAIVRAVESYRPGQQEWITCDIRETEADFCADFLETPAIGEGAAVFMTNPPYGPAPDMVERFVSAALSRGAPGVHVAYLIRFGFFTAACRLEFNERHPADVHPLAPRPTFRPNKHGRKGTDGTDYVWAHWHPGATGRKFPAIDWRDA